MAPVLSHPAVRHFLLALAISWAGWIPYGAAEAGILPFSVPHEIPMFAQYGPLVAAVLLTAAKAAGRARGGFSAAAFSTGSGFDGGSS